MKYFPALESETMKFPRSYIADMIYTLAEKEFKAWVDERVVARNKKIGENNNALVGMDQEFYEVY